MARNLTTGLQRGLQRGLRPGLGGGDLFTTAALDLGFARYKTLDPRITFTRASSGTYVGSDGLIKTATTNEARIDHNPTTGESLGLLVEEQRTNLVTNSATFQPSSGGTPASYTVDQVAPDGTTTASRQTATNPRTFLDYTGIANAQYTFSVYAKVASGTATISLVLKNAATDTVITAGSNVTLTTAWQRLTVTGTTNGAITGTRIEVFGASPGTVFWGAQLEAGAFPTSYIPTTTAAATRSADVVSITGTNFSSWYRQDEGTMYAAVSNMPLPATGNTSLFEVGDGTNSNRIGLFRINAGGYASLAVITSTTQALTNSGAWSATGAIAGAYATDNFASALSGGTLATDTAGALPSPSQARIGARQVGDNYLNSAIRRLTFWPQRLPNSTLQAITR